MVDLRSSPKNNTPNYHKKITANYYYEDEKVKGLYRICRREWMEEGETKKDLMANVL